MEAKEGDVDKKEDEDGKNDVEEIGGRRRGRKKYKGEEKD